MKKIVSLLLCACIFMSLGTFAGAEEGKIFSALIEYDGAKHEYTGLNFSIFVNKSKIETPIPPIVIESGRSIVPVREIFEELGASVNWLEGSPSRVKISYEGKSVTLTIGNKTALVDGKHVNMETGARLVAMNGIGKTMVPVRFVGEMLDMDVDFNPSDASISINSKEETEEIEKEEEKAEEKEEDIEESINELLSLSVKNKGEKLTVTVKTKEPVKDIEIRKLSNPNRYVVDIVDCKIETSKKNYFIYSNIEKIRLGDFEGNGRIVFDVNEMPEVEISYSDDKKTMTIEAVSSVEAAEKAKGPVVLIDAGHGGNEEPGAVAKDGEGKIIAYEKNINLAIAKEVIRLLEDEGVAVEYTRTKDKNVTLQERVDIANEVGASLFVSIHCNAYTSSDVSGSLVMYHTTKDYSDYSVTGKTLATNIMKYLPKAWDTNDKGLLNGDKMYIIKNSPMPCVIVENAFITNGEDLKKLMDEDYQMAAAEAIAKGILDTLPMLTK